jgi:hypothetical protein
MGHGKKHKSFLFLRGWKKGGFEWKSDNKRLSMFLMVPSYVHVSPFLHLLILVLFHAYSEHNPTKHLKPPKLVEFFSSKLIMHCNIFIPTLFTEKLVVDVVINDHQ